MAEELDFSSFIYAAVALAKRYDSDPLRGERYDAVLAELKATMAERGYDLTVGEIEAIFAVHVLPTAHLAEIIEGL